MKRLTLTFDNGPTPGVTDLVLDQLRDRNLQAWFCLVGDALRCPGAADLAHRAMADGHRIANHTATHQVPLGEDPSRDHAEREIAGMTKLMDELLGNWGSHWFRPFGRGGQFGQHLLSDSALEILKELQYSVLIWNSIPRDWDNVNGWVGTALEHIDQQSHTVVVLHDRPTGAMKRLPDFLDTVLDAGIEITLDLPDDCVLLKHGEPCRDLSTLTTQEPS